MTLAQRRHNAVQDLCSLGNDFRSRAGYMDEIHWIRSAPEVPEQWRNAS